MATTEQIKKEFFMALLKGPYEPAVNDVVTEAIVNKELYKKYQTELTTEEFNEWGDLLESEGYLSWNNDGQLALTLSGLEHLSKMHRG